MADGYWNQQPPLNPSSTGMLKRPRPDYELPPSVMPSAHAMQNHLAHEGNHAGPRLVKDTKTIGSAYDRYLQNTAQLPTFTSGEASNFGGVREATTVGGGLPSRPRADPAGPDLARNGRAMGFDRPLLMEPLPRPVRETVPLPPDASNTLYVEGLPSDCKMREVAHIFRPFVGYKEVRLVSKESKHRGGDPLILCFVDFINPACAATALSALQGYKMDEGDSDSSYLRLQFSKHPGPRSGGSAPRRKR